MSQHIASKISALVKKSCVKFISRKDFMKRYKDRKVSRKYLLFYYEVINCV